jgi:hypothetical protein
LEYTIPSELMKKEYSFYVQKQPGLDLKNFEFNLALPAGVEIADADPIVRWVGNRYYFSSLLEKDLPIKITFK